MATRRSSREKKPPPPESEDDEPRPRAKKGKGKAKAPATAPAEAAPMAPKRQAEVEADSNAPKKLSAYQSYMKEQLARIKAANPSLSHDAAFRMVAAGWKQSPLNPKHAPTDWRTPLFYWRGAVVGTKWSGTWVASADGLPSDADFEASTNTFELECSAALPRLASADRATFAGSYKLDNGDGLADHSDYEQRLHAVDGPGGHHPMGECGTATCWAVVAATGNTEFGRFVSLGRLDGATTYEDGYTRLTLARRYIEDDDPRVRESAPELAMRVQGCGIDEWAIAAPWLALPWKVSPLPEEFENVPYAARARIPESAAKAFGQLLVDNQETIGTDWAVGVGPPLYMPLLDYGGGRN